MSNVPSNESVSTVVPVGPGLCQTAPDAPETTTVAPHAGSQRSCARYHDADETQEYYQALLRGLPWPGNGLARRVRTVGLTSCYSGEGVSMVASRAAAAAAGSGTYNALLVDANVGRPSLHSAFDLSLTPGLSEVLSEEASCGAAVQQTRQSHLSVLTAGSAAITGVYEAVDRLNVLLGELKKGFDLVVFDMPAVGQVPSSLEWFRLFDSVVLVVEDERVRWQVGQRTAKSLRRAGANLAGVAFNKRHEHIPNWLYKTL